MKNDSKQQSTLSNNLKAPIVVGSGGLLDGLNNDIRK